MRYVYGAPIAAAMTALYMYVEGLLVSALPPSFLALSMAGGLAQVLATALLIMGFDGRGFVAGTAFSKTEALQAAIFSFLVLDERLSPIAWVGVLIGVTGVLSLALGGAKQSNVFASLGKRGALYGILAGSLFALTGVLVKHATELLPGTDPVAAALVTLTTVMVFQTAMHGAWLMARDPATLRKVVKTWRSSSLVGVLAAVGSACWFTGFATAPVALVRIVGQVEVVFTLAFAHFVLRERLRSHEVIGLLLVGLAVILALTGSRP